MVLSVTSLLTFLVAIPKPELISWLLKNKLISMVLLSKKVQRLAFMTDNLCYFQNISNGYKQLRVYKDQKLVQEIKSFLTA